MARKEAEEIVTEDLELGESVNVPREPPVTVESLARGKILYLQSCAPCHDADGRGRSQRDLKDTDGHPIFARDFTQGIFKGSSEGKQLAYRILAGMPGSPMPGYSGSFQNKPEDLWAVIHHIQSLVPEGAQERVSQKKRRIQAVRVSTALTTDPRVSVWEQASPTYVALMPLWWKDERVEGVIVRALYDGQRIAIRLTWVDPTEDRLALRSQDFGDGAAIQFSSEADPPFFAMGAKEGSVAIWHWKAHWESDLAGYKDVEDAYPRTVVDHYPSAKKTVPGALMTADTVPAVSILPEFLTASAAGNLMANRARTSSIENLSARGFGTLTSNKLSTQAIQGASRWEGGAWDVVFLRSLKIEGDDVEFSPGGAELSIALAIWDGSSGDRNGQKSVTIWHSLKIEK